MKYEIVYVYVCVSVCVCVALLTILLLLIKCSFLIVSHFRSISLEIHILYKLKILIETQTQNHTTHNKLTHSEYDNKKKNCFLLFDENGIDF